MSSSKRAIACESEHRIEGHLTEPVYLIDHIVLPQDSKVFGSITGKHSVTRQARTAAMFNGDLTPLKEADVTFNEVQTPDGRQFQIDTDAAERTTSVVRISSEDQKPPTPFLGWAHRRSLPLDQNANRCGVSDSAQGRRNPPNAVQGGSVPSPRGLGRNAI